MKVSLKILISSALFLLSDSSAAKQQLVHIGEKAELFKSWEKVSDDYLLLKSSPVYLEQDSDIKSKGYHVENSKKIKGHIIREIYDYKSSQSSINVFQQLRASLKSEGYEELFSCDGKVCGDVEGWQLFLSTLIGNNESQQHFVSAVKSDDINGPSYAAFYVTEIDKQPRVLVDIIAPAVNHKFDIVIKSENLVRNIEKDGRVIIDGIFFTLGSSILSNDSEAALSTMATLIKKNNNLQFVIVGHTDNTGTLSRNMTLSKARSAVVQSALITRFGIPSKQISSEGVGPLSPLTSNKDDNGRAFNRRVELVQL